MRGQITRHEIDRVGQVLPCPADARHLGLTTESSLRTDLTRHARHFRSEGTQSINQRVDGALHLEDLALNIDSDFAREIAIRYRGRNLCDVAHLGRKIAGHHVHVIGQIFPGPGNAFDLGLATENSFRSHLTRHARHFRGKRAQLVHHRVDGVF